MGYLFASKCAIISRLNMVIFFLEMPEITENQIESLTIQELEALGWSYLHGLAIAPEAQFRRSRFTQGCHS
jgi:hypothetical protein